MLPVSGAEQLRRLRRDRRPAHDLGQRARSRGSTGRRSTASCAGRKRFQRPRSLASAFSSSMHRRVEVVAAGRHLLLPHRLGGPDHLVHEGEQALAEVLAGGGEREVHARAEPSAACRRGVGRGAGRRRCPAGAHDVAGGVGDLAARQRVLGPPLPAGQLVEPSGPLQLGRPTSPRAGRGGPAATSRRRRAPAPWPRSPRPSTSMAPARSALSRRISASSWAPATTRSTSAARASPAGPIGGDVRSRPCSAEQRRAGLQHVGPRRRTATAAPPAAGSRPLRATSASESSVELRTSPEREQRQRRAARRRARSGRAAARARSGVSPDGVVPWTKRSADSSRSASSSAGAWRSSSKRPVLRLPQRRRPTGRAARPPARPSGTGGAPWGRCGSGRRCARPTSMASTPADADLVGPAAARRWR